MSRLLADARFVAGCLRPSAWLAHPVQTSGRESTRSAD